MEMFSQHDDDRKNLIQSLAVMMMMVLMSLTCKSVKKRNKKSYATQYKFNHLRFGCFCFRSPGTHSEPLRGWHGLWKLPNNAIKRLWCQTQERKRWNRKFTCNTILVSHLDLDENVKEVSNNMQESIPKTLRTRKNNTKSITSSDLRLRFGFVGAFCRIFKCFQLFGTFLRASSKRGNKMSYTKFTALWDLGQESELEVCKSFK